MLSNGKCFNFITRRFLCAPSKQLSSANIAVLPFSRRKVELVTPDKMRLPNFLAASRNYTQSSKTKAGHVPSFYDRYVFPQPPDVVSEEEHNIVVEQVNDAITDADKGRLFAIVFVAGKQYKITDHDLIRTDGNISANVGDKLRLEKVLLLGGQNFTLIGRPLLKRSLVKVEATVIEKTPGAEKVIQYFRRKSSFQKKFIYTPSNTVLRINCVEAFPTLV